jgi:uncharacterized repeat protein (TIGR01451 family)
MLLVALAPPRLLAGPCTNVADLAICDTASQPVASIGDFVDFFIAVTNFGPDAAVNVVVQDSLPPGLSFVAAYSFDTNGYFDVTNNEWYITNLDAGASALLDVTLQVNAAGSWTNDALILSSGSQQTNFTSNSASAVIIVNPLAPVPADLSIAESAGANSVQVGELAVLTLVLSNAGPNDVTNEIDVSTLVPNGYQYVADDGGQTNGNGLYDPQGGTWSVPALPAGASVEIDITCLATNAGLYTDTATITVPPEIIDLNTNNNSSFVVLTNFDATEPMADLALSMTMSTNAVQIADPVVFTTTLSNLGPSGASNIVVQIFPPMDVQFVSAAADAGSSYDETTGLWSVGVLANGASINLAITDIATMRGDHANTALIIASSVLDTNSANNQATAEADTLVNTAYVGLTQSVDQSNVLVGATFNLTITATNLGPQDAEQLVVNETFPRDMAILSWTAPPGTTYDPCSNNWTIPTLCNGSVTSLVLTAVALRPATLSVEAAFTAMGSVDPNPTNTSAAVTINISLAQYVVNATALGGGSITPSGSTNVQAGDSITFTATPMATNEVGNWTVDGAVVQAGGTNYYFADILASHSVQVSFNPISDCSGSEVAINFDGGADGGILQATDVAGALAQPGWVDAVGSAGSIALDGGVTVNWYAPQTATLNGAVSPPDFALMDGYLSCAAENAYGNTTVVVNGLTLSSYDVYVYCAGNNQPGNESRVGEYSLATLSGNTTLYAQNSAAQSGFNGTYIQAGSSNGGPGASVGNYLVFSNVTGSTFFLNASGNYTSGVTYDAPINALQVVPAGAAAVPPVLSPLRFTSMAPISASNVLVTLAGTAGVPVEIQVSSNLLNWTPRFALYNTNGVLAFTDCLMASHLFYRAVQGGAPSSFDGMGFTGAAAGSNSSGEITLSGTLTNLQFDWQSTDPTLGVIDTGMIAASNVIFFPGTLTCPPRLLFQGAQGGLNFNFELLLQPYNQIVADVTQTAGNVVNRIRYLFAFSVYLEVDSDNNNGLGMPDGLPAERNIRDDPKLPGKVIRVDDNRTGGIPGFANFDAIVGKAFAEVVLTLPAPIDPTKALVTFTYDASDPAAVVVEGPADNPVYTPAAGHLRLWTKDASVARDPSSAAAAGNFIPTKVQIPASKLGFTAANRTQVLFVEGISPGASPGDQRVLVNVDPDGSGSFTFCSDAVRLSVVEVVFSRAVGADGITPDESAAGNAYGYDDTTHPYNHISVQKNGQTFFNVKVTGLGANVGTIQFVPSDATVATVTVPAATPAAGFRLQVNGQNQNKVEAQIKACCGIPTGDLCDAIFVDVYTQIAISGNYYRAFKTGAEDATIPPEVPVPGIEKAANSYLKYPVIKVALTAPKKMDLPFDINGNGVVDYYNNGPSPETKKIYEDLLAKGVHYSDIVLFKDNFIDNWYISKDAKVGDTVISLPPNTKMKGLNINGFYRIAIANDSDADYFKITAKNAAACTITINKALTKAHPKATSTLKSQNDVVGLGSDKDSDQPALIVGAAADEIGKLLAHEQMHGQSLSDVNNLDNVMHWTTDSNPQFIPFTFNPQTAVVTGSDNKVVPEKLENQWTLPKGR